MESTSIVCHVQCDTGSYPGAMEAAGLLSTEISKQFLAEAHCHPCPTHLNDTLGGLTISGPSAHPGYISIEVTVPYCCADYAPVIQQVKNGIAVQILTENHISMIN